MNQGRKAWHPLPRCALQNFFGPLIETFARQLGRQRCLAMHFRIDAEHHLTGESLVRFLADLRAGFDVVFHGFMEGIPEGFDRICMEADTITDTGENGGEKVDHGSGGMSPLRAA